LFKALKEKNIAEIVLSKLKKFTFNKDISVLFEEYSKLVE
jgi:hypothetical protein